MPCINKNIPLVAVNRKILKNYNNEIKVENWGLNLPLIIQHNSFCVRKGIELKVCNCVNKIIDYPERYVVELLENHNLRKHLYEIFGFEWVYEVYMVNKEWYSHHSGYRRYLTPDLVISHAKLHGEWKGDLKLIKKLREFVKEIAGFLFGENGRKAFDLHFELDALDHVEKEISALLSSNIKGSVFLGDRWLPASNVLRIALNSKDSRTILQTAKDIGNYNELLHNLRELFQKESHVIPGKTLEQLIVELEGLSWLKPLVDECLKPPSEISFAEYKCPLCGRITRGKEGEYFCYHANFKVPMRKIRDL